MSRVDDSKISNNPGDEADPGAVGSGEAPCPKCAGSGKKGDQDCPNCGGSGVITEGVGGA